MTEVAAKQVSAFFEPEFDIGSLQKVERETVSHEYGVIQTEKEQVTKRKSNLKKSSLVTVDEVGNRERFVFHKTIIQSEKVMWHLHIAVRILSADITEHEHSLDDALKCLNDHYQPIIGKESESPTWRNHEENYKPVYGEVFMDALEEVDKILGIRYIVNGKLVKLQTANDRNNLLPGEFFVMAGTQDASKLTK